MPGAWFPAQGTALGVGADDNVRARAAPTTETGMQKGESDEVWPPPGVTVLELGADWQDVVCLMAPLADHTVALTSAEAAALGKAVARRRHEYASGRWLARQALRRSGCAAAELLAGADRVPQWPEAVCGSITHTDAEVAVAVTARAAWAGLGIDLEKCGRVGAALMPRLLTDAERERLGPRDPTLVFSAKEACYKMIFPLKRQFIGFHEVEIDLEDGNFGSSGRFCARYLGSDGRQRALEQAEGRYLCRDGHWLTAMRLREAR